ncbi:P-loop containing nucleoside triphosphate hydrolase protein [Calocera viscosa TUFC12733]|uniref:DNA 3'-5' helicase n=1 Tax=Calocera viscosa (strain TUFC12733) TaxID=1330018 RepID=A0A167RLV7_CALVF|nr:P-loop containing nucleoside triphosphate hydrolase protein [Calocera viscosa TUFC12733]
MSYNYANQQLHYSQNGQHANYEYDDPINDFESSDSRGVPTSPTPAYTAAPQGYYAPPIYDYYEEYQNQPYQYAPAYATGHGHHAVYPPQTSSSSEGYYEAVPPVSMNQHDPPRYHPQTALQQTAYIQRPRIRPEQPVSEAEPAPTSAPPRNKHGIPLRPVSELPDIYRGLFKFGVFNAMQSKCYETALHSDDNMVISAPTGSGKTVLFELAIVRLLMEGDSGAKCVYMAPTKALCSERFNDWTAKFQGLGISCCELTGDTDDSSKKAWARAKNSTIIVTTPEKWDSLTRNWTDNSVILAQMKLFLVDEVHILNENRGATLEVCLARMRLWGSNVRFVLVSATVPNIEDVASWIGDGSVGESQGSARVLKFGEEFRPCPIRRIVLGFPRKPGANDYQFNSTLDFKVFNALQEHAQQKPALIFCATRKGVISAAEQIAKEYKALMESKGDLPWPAPKHIDVGFHDKALQDLARYGVGVHHAGVHVSDRRAVEQLFTQKQLRVVVATSTLAVGVNFPAHTVIIKGTKQWSDKGFVEYSDLDIMQMIGRAGRPQFDKEGVAVIMTESSHEARYKALASGRTLLESSLHLNLTEHINSEIKLSTICSTDSAKDWLRSSFLFQRIQKNPRHYSMGKDEKQTWDARLDELVDDSLKKLEAAELIRVEDGGRHITATEFGEVMSRYYIRFHTMCLILQLPEKISSREILDMISNAAEFQDVRMRTGERQMLEILKLEENIRFRPQKIGKVSDKVFLLLQAVLGGINLNSAEYKTPDAQAPHMEASFLFKNAPKLAKAVADVGIIKQNGPHIKYGMELMRSLNARTWEDRPAVLRQIDQIGEKSLMTLHVAGIRNIASLRQCEPQRLEALLNRNPPFGRDVMNSVRALPAYSLSVEEVSVEPSSGNRPVSVALRISVGVTCESGKKKKGKTVHLGMTSILTLTSDMEVVDFRRIPTKSLMEDDRTYDIEAELTKPSQFISVSISGDNFAGLTVATEYKPALAPTQYPTMDTRPAPANNDTLDEWQELPIDELDGVDQDSFWKDFETIDESDFLDLTGDDDQDNDHAAPQKRRNQVAPAKALNSNSAGSGVRLPNGNYPCNHQCRDKHQCRHPCCQEGVPAKRFKRADSGKTTVSRPQTVAPAVRHSALVAGRGREVAPTNTGSKPLLALEKLHSSVRPMSNPGRPPIAKLNLLSRVPNSTDKPGSSAAKSPSRGQRNERLDDDDDLPDVGSAIQDALEPSLLTDDDDDIIVVEAIRSSPPTRPRSPPKPPKLALKRHAEPVILDSKLQRSAEQLLAHIPSAKRRRTSSPSESSDRSTVVTVNRFFPKAPSNTAGAQSRLARYVNAAPVPTTFREFTPSVRPGLDHRSGDSETVQNFETPLFLDDSDEAEQVQRGPQPASSTSELDMPMLLDTVCEIVPSDDDDLAGPFADPSEVPEYNAVRDVPDEPYLSDDANSVDASTENITEDPTESAIHANVHASFAPSAPDFFRAEHAVQEPAFDFLEPMNFGPSSDTVNTTAPSQTFDSLDDVFSFDQPGSGEAGEDPWADFNNWMKDPRNVA